MNDTHQVGVTCRQAGDGWQCDVKVGTDPGATEHRVAVTPDVLQRLRPGANDPEQLVRDSFAFLLERETRESILRSFELPVIGRYFPEWQAEISRR